MIRTRAPNPPRHLSTSPHTIRRTSSPPSPRRETSTSERASDVPRKALLPPQPDEPRPDDPNEGAEPAEAPFDITAHDPKDVVATVTEEGNVDLGANGPTTTTTAAPAPPPPADPAVSM